jgi:hypothetical protein
LQSTRSLFAASPETLYSRQNTDPMCPCKRHTDVPHIHEVWRCRGNAHNFHSEPSAPGVAKLPLFFGQMTAALHGIGLVARRCNMETAPQHAEMTWLHSLAMTKQQPPRVLTPPPPPLSPRSSQSGIRSVRRVPPRNRYVRPPRLRVRRAMSCSAWLTTQERDWLWRHTPPQLAATTAPDSDRNVL